MEDDQGWDLLDRPLYRTPTWAVSAVCSVFIIVSVAAERFIHIIGDWFRKTNRKPLFHALEKIKDEFMVLGFISLVLTVTQNYISQFCVDSTFYDRQPTPCKRFDDVLKHDVQPACRAKLASGFGISCMLKGKEPFVSYESLEQLHRFIFVLGITHVIYTCVTMILALGKIYSWRSWEFEAHAENHDSLTEITKHLTMRRQSTFVLYHTSSRWSKNRLLVWVMCFFRQFGQSVTRADYLTLRLGFITNHHTRSNYDFHGYMIRTVEDEFQKIVGISTPLWMFVIAFLLCNVHGKNLYFWIAFVPVILVIVVGAKLQHVIATLALENAGIRGHHIGSSLRPRDELFWFKKPELLLLLIHFILFQNAFEVATFIWTLWEFGPKSCLMADEEYRKYLYVYTRLIFGLLAQFLCSYSTLPLYALVTQMGSNYKKAIFQESIVHSIHAWRKTAQEKAKLLGKTGREQLEEEEQEQEQEEKSTSSKSSSSISSSRSSSSNNRNNGSSKVLKRYASVSQVDKYETSTDDVKIELAYVDHSQHNDVERQ